MQLFARAFDVGSRYFDTDMSLLPVEGYGARFAEFKPQRFIQFELLNSWSLEAVF
jgi:hypothetical protein